MAKGEKLPGDLQANIKKLTGADLDEVRVHYNSALPALEGAQAFTKGTDIHLGPGQNHQLAHEAVHIVQQRQGRVSDTVRSHFGLSIQDDAAMEREADLMARRASGKP
jgi:hypothetical protein